jgi:hypothetical protein
VCAHGTAYGRQRLEEALVAKFRTAMTPDLVAQLTARVQANVAALVAAQGGRADTIKAEVGRLEREAAHLVRFLAEGGASEIVGEELRSKEYALVALRQQLALQDQVRPTAPPRVHPTLIQEHLAGLEGLLRDDPARAKAERSSNTWTARWRSNRGPHRGASTARRSQGAFGPMGCSPAWASPCTSLSQ